MTIRKIKLFLDFEKEEKWLNEMAQKGFHFVSYKFGRFYFEEGAPGKYIYRIQMLNDYPDSEETKEYLAFMEESGVEVLDTYNSWVYFRKKASDGPFEIYSDIPSRIEHYKRVAKALGIVALVNVSIACINLSFSTFHMFLSFINFIAAAILLIPYSSLMTKVKKLNEEVELFDK